ncbi:MAG: tRNA (pseudouridine(54)-N(1))-methyltransferase TrmY [Candidatus Nanohaloarchaea archaeon]|nr:tRNA (pseudouridine(54)-N(1))-methyltransferase TrmY [Candidatus Nanohaloarchaea archaeon]
MPQFIVLGHDPPTDADFSLDDLTQGRLDLLARSVNAALLQSHRIRTGTTVSLVLQDEATVQFRGDDIGGLNPDERSIAGVIRKALQRLDGRGSLPDGVATKTHGLEPVLEGAGQLFQLRGDGTPVTDAAPGQDATFVLSDHRPFTDPEQQLLDKYGAEKVSLGPETLHTDHAITVAHNYLDTAGYTEY